MPSPPRSPASSLLRALRVALLPVGALSACGPDAGTGTSTEAIQVCARGTTVEGVDVSEYQGTIDWAAVHAAGRRFAIARIGDGLYRDPTFARNWSGIRANGMIRGAYQYFRPGLDPVAQADIVVGAVGMLGAGDLPVTIDVETAGGQSASTIVANIRRWIARVEAGTGKPPIVYTAQYFWNTAVGGSGAFAMNPLWVANYGPTCPNMPTGWSNWDFFQYSSTGAVNGIRGNVDLDKFNGSLADLTAFAMNASGPRYAAAFVRQSFPTAASGALVMYPGQDVPSFIELRNTGTAPWDARTRLATTQPRDRSSALAGADWLQPDRPAGVTGTVMPGGTYRFAFTFHAPATPGRFDEHFGVVEEGVAWFSDPGQGGPPDDQLEAIVEVRADLDAATASDASASDARAASSDARRTDAGLDADGGGATHAQPGGCGCAAPARPRAPGWALCALALAAASARRRASRRARSR